MRFLALIFAIFFALLAAGFALLLHKLRKNRTFTAYLAFGYMIAASLVFLVSAILGIEQVRLIVCVVLAGALLLWAVVDLAKKVRTHTFRLHQGVWILLYLALIAIILLRAFKLL